MMGTVPFHGKTCRQLGPLHLGFARILATAILCEVVVFGQSVGEEHHHHGGSVGHVEGNVSSLAEGNDVIVNDQSNHSAGDDVHDPHQCHPHHAVHTCEGGFLTPRHVLAYVMLGTVVLGVSIIHLVNHPDARVRSATYKITATSISVYCAVLLNRALMQVLDAVSQMIHWPMEIVFGCLIFLAMHSLLCAMCWYFQQRARWLMAMEKLGGHLLAFSGFVGFGNMLFSCWFENTIFMPAYDAVGNKHAHYTSYIKYAAVTVGVFLGLVLFFAVNGRLLRKYFTPDSSQHSTSHLPIDSLVHVQKHNWVDKTIKATHEALALITGFLVLQTLSFWLTDKQPALHEHICREDVDPIQAAILFLFGFVFIMVLVVITCIKAKRDQRCSSESDSESESIIINLPKAVLLVLALSGGYCIERSSKWLMMYWLNDSEVAYVVSAFFLTMATVFSVLVMSRYITGDETNAPRAEKTALECATEDLLEASAVIVGLAWDHAFMVCQTVLVDHYDETYQLNRACSALVMAIFLCACVLPGWMNYILPAAHKTLEEHTQDRECVRQQNLQWDPNWDDEF